MQEYDNSRTRPATEPKTPLLDDVQKAGARRNIPSSQIIYEINEYAKRNLQCHNGLRNLIDTASWKELAELTTRDKKRLREIYRTDLKGQERMWQCIDAIEREWFESVYVTADGVQYFPSEKALQKWKRIHRRAGGQWSITDESELETLPVEDGVGRIV
ncbi:MAG: hypothetical protein LQ338_002807 [Usnochroma carphineum]|nr:MAG: hypothetical protein LQ338_002807 [Usnochroma carphineum]